MLNVKVLLDDSALPDKYYTAEHGFCLFIKTGGKKILFDAGYSDLFIKNAALMGADLTKIDAVALSHGHSDHTWGLNHLIQFYDRKKIRKKPCCSCTPTPCRANAPQTAK